jgi:FtsH-binding integral membrane protein
LPHANADIVYDTFEIIKRYSVDAYVWASVGLYLDILNLFLRLLEILGMARGSD